MAIETLKTGTGSRFQYKRHPDGEIIVYPQSGGRYQTRSALVITPYTADLVRQAIKRAGTIAVGASRDNPPPDSLGWLLKQDKQSPQQLSYLVPLLVQEGFCTWVSRDRALVVRYRGQ